MVAAGAVAVAERGLLTRKNPAPELRNRRPDTSTGGESESESESGGREMTDRMKRRGRGGSRVGRGREG